MPLVINDFQQNPVLDKTTGISSIIDPTSRDPYPLQLCNEFAPIGAASLRMLYLLRTEHRRIEGKWSELPTFISNNTGNRGIFDGLLLSRGRTDVHLVDNFGNFGPATESLLKLLEDEGYHRHIPDLPNLATEPTQILWNNHLTWFAYSALWDSVHPEPQRDKETRRYGTLKYHVSETLQKLGLSLPWEFPRTGSRGRPAKGVLPTKWGVRLVFLLDRMGIQVTDDMRMMARYSHGNRTGKRDLASQRLYEEYQNLGIKPPIELDPPTPKVVPLKRPNLDELDKLPSPRINPRILDEYPSTRTPELIEPKIVEEPTLPETVQIVGPPPPNYVEPERQPFVIDHRDLPEDWDKEDK